MIPFFRKSRKGLFVQNKFSRYLLYAIGEIILVVIGILIALSINNWNEDRKDLIIEQQVLRQLKEEYESNLTQLEEKIAMREYIVSSAFKGFSYIDNPEKLLRDSLISSITLLLVDPTFDPINNDLFSSGNIRLIRNERLKQLLTNWSSDVIALQEIEKLYTKTSSEIVTPLYIKFGITREALYYFWNLNNVPSWFLDKKSKHNLQLTQPTKSTKSRIAIDYKELEGVLSVAIIQNESANLQSIALRNRILEILEILNKEINWK